MARVRLRTHVLHYFTRATHALTRSLFYKHPDQRPDFWRVMSVPFCEVWAARMTVMPEIMRVRNGGGGPCARRLRAASQHEMLSTRAHHGTPAPQPCPSGYEWRRPLDDAELALRLVNRTLCPEQAPFQNHFVFAGKTGCCAADVARLVYDRCRDDQRAWETINRAHSAAAAGADALQRRRVLVVGDSMSQQWANALLLDLHARGRLVGPENALVWNRTVTFFSRTRMACSGLPLYRFDARAISAAAPVVAVAPMIPELRNYPEFHRCLNASKQSATSPPLGYLTRVLQRLRPHVVVANYGLHWHGAQTQHVGSYSRDVTALVSTLAAYGTELAASPTWHDAPPLTVLLDTPPQHYVTPQGDGSFDTRERGRSSPGSSCASHLNAAALQTTSHGPAAFNRLAQQAVLDHHHGRAPRASNATSPIWLPAAFAPLLERPDAHAIPDHTAEMLSAVDCSHICYSPLLWDAQLAPFYCAVAGRFSAIPVR
jgi:hypothetical protein